MKSTLALLLLLGLVFTVAVVRADDDGGSGGEAPAAEAEAPAAEGESEEAKPAKGADPSALPPQAQLPLDAIPALPVTPLAMDAAALQDDDRMFDQLPKALTGAENVEALTESLKKASALLNKMKRDVEGEKVWTKSVYDIIANYQYKYAQTVRDVHTREAKLAKMTKLVAALKASTLHSAVEQELGKASKALSELVTRSGASGSVYSKITARMGKLKAALKHMPRPRELFSETTEKMQHILSSDLPPKTSDALQNLVSGGAKEEEEEVQENVPTPQLKAAKPQAAKKTHKPQAPAKKGAAPKVAPKKAAAAPKKAAAPKAKKAAAPKAAKKAPAEEEDE